MHTIHSATRTNSTRCKYPTFDRPVWMPGGNKTVGPYTAVTLFSGMGGSSKAARDLGHRVLAHDFMPEAVDTLTANGFDAVLGDVRQVDFTDPIYANVKVVEGGPPCQPFSQGGRNKGQYDPRDMMPDFLRCVSEILPETFILENVRGLAGPRHKDYLAKVVSDFEALGYAVDRRVLDCAHYGAGQARKRLFIIGRRLDVVSPTSWAISWPRKRPEVTMAQVLGWTPQTCQHRNLQAPEPAWDGVAALWPMTRPSTTVVGSFRPEVQAAPGYRSTGDGPRQNAPGSVVTTVQERLVLQQMPPTWKMRGSTAKIDLQIGNSVPAGVMRDLLALNS